MIINLLKSRIKRNIFIVFVFLLNFTFLPDSTHAQLSKSWDKDFGGLAGGNNDQFTTTIPTPDGGYLLAGSSNSNQSFFKISNCKGNFDFWIIKISATGVWQWDKTFGGTQEDLLQCISRTADGGYLLGGSSKSNILAPDKSQNSFGDRDFWIIKIDANGNKLWDKTFGGTGADELRSIVPTASGFILGGYSDSNSGGSKTENSKGATDYWIVSIDNNGNKLWDKTIGGNGNDYLLTMIPYSNGLLLGGYSYSNISSDKSQSSRGLEGNSDYWVVKVDNSGSKIWDITLGGFGDETLNAMIGTRDGGVLLAGHSFSGKNGDKTTDNFDPNNTGDFWVVKIIENTLKNGAIEKWDKSFGGNDHDLLYDIIGTSDGNYLLTGASISGVSGNKTYTNKGGYDYWIVKMDPNGNKIWDVGYGGNKDEYAQKLVAVSDGYLLGGYSQTAINGDKTQNNLGGNDYWVIKLLPTSTFSLVNTMSGMSGNYLEQYNLKETADSPLPEKPLLYPNPATEQVTLAVSILENTLVDISIINSIGVPVYLSSEIGKSKNYIKTMDVSGLAAGTYSVRIDMGIYSIIQQLIIVK